jgi:hypothetical protein
MALQDFRAVGVCRLDARKRAERPLHTKECVQRLVRTEPRGARGRKHHFDGGCRLARVENGARDEGQRQRLIAADDAPVKELSRSGGELCPRGVVDDGHKELGASPDVDNPCPLRAKEPSMGPFERAQPARLVGRQLGLHIAAKALPRQSIAPEGATSLLEPRVFRRVVSRSGLEGRTKRSHALGSLRGATELDDARHCIENSGPLTHGRSSGVSFLGVSRPENRVFFPQAALDDWIVDGRVELSEGELRIFGEGRRFKLIEAIHVLREVSGLADERDWIGRVRPREFFAAEGAEIVQTSMLAGELAYDVELGWLGFPAVSFASFLATSGPRWIRSPQDPPEPKSDEELLARLLVD